MTSVLSYEALSEKCKAKGVLYEDRDFPRDNSSLCYSKKPPVEIEWKRPKDICADPKFLIEGASRHDIEQGMLGDGWLLSAISSLTTKSDLLNRVVPLDQSFDNGKYFGAFHFQFWQYGEWKDVIVDDYLPTYRNRLVYLHSKVQNEFWSALLEKAYAKLHGSYEALKGGAMAEAMEDFTGGITEQIDLEKPPTNLYLTMLKATQISSLMGCAIQIDKTKVDGKTENGLVAGNAYSITDVRKIEFRGQSEELVRLLNSWGKSEWTGDWSDKSEKWRMTPSSERERLGLKFENDGEFWMSFDDFRSNFTLLEICHLGPDTYKEGSPVKKWRSLIVKGKWLRGVTAGGCRNYLDTFWTNPQYRVKLGEEDNDAKSGAAECICSLMQVDRRKMRKTGAQNLAIGFTIYKLPDTAGSGPFGKDFFRHNNSVARSENFKNSRSISGRFNLPVGEYVIVPSTLEPNQDGHFILRIFSEEKADAVEMDDITTKESVPRQPLTEAEKALEDMLKGLYNKLAGADKKIDAYELKDILNQSLKTELIDSKSRGFEIEACRSMIAMLSAEKSGTLDFNDFKKVWEIVREWKKIFYTFDKSKDGAFNMYELRQALRKGGYRLSNEVYLAIFVRYSNKAGTITIDDFILITVRLQNMIDTYNRLKEENKISMFLDTWLISTLS